MEKKKTPAKQKKIKIRGMAALNGYRSITAEELRDLKK